MSLLDLTRIGRPALLFTAAITLTAAWPAAAQTSIKFSLDGRLEGLTATFLLPQDRGYFKNEGLDVTLGGAATMLEPITRCVGRVRYGPRRYQHPHQVSRSASLTAGESGVHGLQQTALRDRGA